MSSMPAAAKTSASPSVPTVMPARAGLELHPGERHALVRLDVRPQPDAACAEVLDEAPVVRLDDVEVDDECWGVEAWREDRRARRRRRSARRSSRPVIGAPRSAPTASRAARSRASPCRPARASDRSVESLTSRRQPVPAVPDPRISPGRTCTSADARASISPNEYRAADHRPLDTGVVAPAASVTVAVIARSGPVAPATRASASSSGVTSQGPMEVAKSLPLAGPIRTGISSRWRSRADQSLRTK